MKKPWGTTAVILVVAEAISSCSITQATTSPLASDIAAVVDDGDGGSHHSKDRAEEEPKEFSRVESSGKDLQHQQQLQLKNVARSNENKLMGFFLQEAEMDEGDAYYPASIRKTVATTTTTANMQFSGDDVLKESRYYYYRPSSSSNKATRRAENDRELQRYHDGYDETSSTETPTATPSSAPTTTRTLASSAPTLSITTTAHRSNNGYSSLFFPKAYPSPSTITAGSRDSIEFLTGAPTTTMAIRGAAAEAPTSSPQTTAVVDGITETGSSSSSPPPSFPTAPPSTLVSLDEPREVDGAPRLLVPTWDLSSTAAATVVVVAAVVLASFPFTEIIV